MIGDKELGNGGWGIAVNSADEEPNPQGGKIPAFSSGFRRNHCPKLGTSDSPRH
jgi:hypothetical protein